MRKRSSRTDEGAMGVGRAVVVALAMAPALGACASDVRPPPLERAGVSVPSPGTSIAGESDDDGVAGDLGGDDRFPIDGHLAGRLGSITLDATPYRMEGRVEHGYAHLAVFAEGDGGEGMIALDVHGGLDHPDLADGGWVELRGLVTRDPADLAVNLIGCSGLRAPDWDYDQSATEVRIRVRPGVAADQLTVEVEASFGSTLETPSSVRGFVVLGR
ncbi:MAG: hypothetical protein IT379_24905 [Deltaproteobacteria bacterium]|nr:hypothetical protein [Deltaproteobacteria bacterium]